MRQPCGVAGAHGSAWRALGLQRYRGFADHLDQRLERFRHAFAGRGREQQRRLLRRALQAVALLLQFVRRNRVDLVQRHDLDLVGEMALIGLELGSHRLVGLAGMLAGRIDQMQQHAAALDMAEKSVAEASAFMRALDQAREYRRARIRGPARSRRRAADAAS